LEKRIVNWLKGLGFGDDYGTSPNKNWAPDIRSYGGKQEIS